MGAEAGQNKPAAAGHQQQREGGAVKRKKEKERAMIEQRIKMLDEETAKELEKGLEDEDYRIEKILKHADDRKGVRQYKVRFVGYGPKDDLWYDERDLQETAPEMVEAYEEALEEEQRVSRQGQQPKGRKEPEGKKAAPKRRGIVGSGRV